MRKILAPAVVWAVLSVWSWTASGQAGGGQPPAEQPPTPTAMTTPAMTGPLAANPNPTSVDAGFLGPVYVTGAVSGLGLWQNNKFPDQEHAQAILNNGQVFLQKTEGLFQYYIDVGAYTFPILGAPYFSTGTTVGDFYGPVPIAWAKIAPTDNFYIQGGKLPTLIGAENVFTFRNMNIERGLLFAQEPTISRGGQLGYTQGPLALGLSYDASTVSALKSGNGCPSGCKGWMQT
jgi:Putative beta-barrel porin-2, OmpL-like. bbp2